MLPRGRPRAGFRSPDLQNLGNPWCQSRPPAPRTKDGLSHRTPTGEVHRTGETSVPGPGRTPAECRVSPACRGPTGTRPTRLRRTGRGTIRASTTARLTVTGGRRPALSSTGGPPPPTQSRGPSGPRGTSSRPGRLKRGLCRTSRGRASGRRLCAEAFLGVSERGGETPVPSPGSTVLDPTVGRGVR